jgi:hypothetical protein
LMVEDSRLNTHLLVISAERLGGAIALLRQRHCW